MNKILLVLLLIVSGGGAASLDSLLLRSSSSKLAARKTPGFVSMPLIPLDSEITRQEKSTVNFSRADSALAKRVANLEADDSKIRTILENHQLQSEFITKNLDALAKIFQLLAGILGTIATIVGSIIGYLKLKKGMAAKAARAPEAKS